MKILIVSDTHGRNGNFKAVYQAVSPVDMVLHLGDVEGAEETFASMLKCPFYAVAGNNDFFTSLPMEQEIQIGTYKAFLCHGHYYRVSMTNQLLADEARARGCSLAFYGHTHRPMIERNQDVTLLNPGSLSFPRQDNRKPSYMIMDIDRHNEAHFTICYL